MRPFIFMFEKASTGNMGDRKPLAILSVLFARFCHDPIHLLFPNEQIQQYRFFPKLAKFHLGEEWLSHFVFHVMENSQQRNAFAKTGFVIGLSVVKGPNQFGLNVDFGDNDITHPSARFVSCLLKDFRPGVLSFGSLYLPPALHFSENAVILELRKFYDRNAKVLGIAGSQTPPVKLAELMKWHKQHDTWAIALLGYKQEKEANAEKKQMVSWLQQPNVFLIEFYVEYEDFVKFIDFYICNGGAGSVIAGLAYGCPQMCGNTGTFGLDKASNCRSLPKFGVGPSQNAKTFHFAKAMEDVELNMVQFIKRAKSAQKLIRSEQVQMMQNLELMVTQLQTAAVDLNRYHVECD